MDDYLWTWRCFDSEAKSSRLLFRLAYLGCFRVRIIRWFGYSHYPVTAWRQTSGAL